MSNAINNKYTYRPIKFYALAFLFTWGFWITAIIIGDESVSPAFMLLGLLSPAVIAVIMVFGSKSDALKADFKRKIIGFYRLKPVNILLGIILFLLIVFASIIVSIIFGESFNQLSFTDGFSFSIGGASALLTILLASSIEEIGWRGYGEDSVAQYFNWFTESVIFGFVWAIWHLPLFWIPGTYHYGLKELGAGFVINFLVSVIPLGFITTWVYVKNNRSMLASIIFHLFVNTMQEKIAMTPVTKCVETGVVTVAAIIIVFANREMFFEKKHIGNILSEK